MHQIFLRVCVSALLHHTKYRSETGLQNVFIIQLLLFILFFHKNYRKELFLKHLHPVHRSWPWPPVVTVL